MGATQGFDYGIELIVPQDQRKLLQDNLDLYRWQHSERMDEAQLRRFMRLAPAQIQRLLATEGYYNPIIKTALEQRDGKWLAKLDITPGQPARVDSIELRVTGPFDDGSAANRTRLEKMRSDWSLQRGAIFRQQDWESAKRSALRALLLQRYPAARISASRATVDPRTNRVDLLVTLDSGPAFTFGALEVHGLKRYPASIVERLNPIHSGDDYSQAKLLDLQSRLQDSPYFAGASVNVETDAARPDDVPIQVTVQENPAKKLGFGIGYSTDTGTRGQVNYQDLNLAGRAWRLTEALKLDSKSQALNTGFQLPMTHSGFHDSFNLLLERTDIEGEVTRKIDLGGKRTRTQGRNETTVGIHYVTERQYVAGTPVARNSSLVPSYAWTRRDVDNLLFPTRGYVLTLEADAAAKPLLSDQSFLRGHGRVNWFYPFNPSNQLILRAELGAIASDGSDGIPSSLLFRTGGDQTVRGYAYQSLGVRQGDAIVGGRYLAVASVEYVHWFTRKWGAAVFTDAGDAADQLKDLSLARGYGLGARWRSPVGPLNLDVAYGSRTRATRLHFSVGFSF